jgi:hypothetical protein
LSLIKDDIAQTVIMCYTTKMITKEYAVEICKIAAETEDEIDMQVAADALEELGDIRGPIIRAHLKCCYRAINIIIHFINYRMIFSDTKHFPELKSKKKYKNHDCNKEVKFDIYRKTTT